MPARAGATPSATVALCVMVLVGAWFVYDAIWSLLARHADVSQATCHAILATLVDAGYVVRDPSSKSYSLGPAFLGLGDAAARAFPEVRVARVELDGHSGLRDDRARLRIDAQHAQR